MTQIKQFQFSVNLLQSILWQWDDDPVLTSIIKSKQNWYYDNQYNFWTNWFTDVFDLRTANEFGCVIWAIILGFPLTYILSGTLSVNPFGFGPDGVDSAANGNQNWFNSNFASNQTEQFVLTLPEKRIVLQLRFRQLFSRGNIPEVNKIFSDILVPTYGEIYAIDNYNMSMTIVCVAGIPAFLGFLFTQFDLIPRPAGVSLAITD